MFFNDRIAEDKTTDWSYGTIWTQMTLLHPLRLKSGRVVAVDGSITGAPTE